MAQPWRGSDSDSSERTSREEEKSLHKNAPTGTETKTDGERDPGTRKRIRELSTPYGKK
jgi:hypothetical protein